MLVINKKDDDLFRDVLDLKYQYAILNNSLSELMMHTEFLQHALVTLDCEDGYDKEELLSDICDMRCNILKSIMGLDEEKANFNKALVNIEQSLLDFKIKNEGGAIYGI